MRTLFSLVLFVSVSFSATANAHDPSRELAEHSIGLLKNRPAEFLQPPPSVAPLQLSGDRQNAQLIRRPIEPETQTWRLNHGVVYQLSPNESLRFGAARESLTPGAVGFTFTIRH
ncbi:hypothetical protein H0X32_01980 [Patescibacteria group bacterium]|nr:hypothetical protein [Patescibacteria group bacterium]